MSRAKNPRFQANRLLLPGKRTATDVPSIGISSTPGSSGGISPFMSRLNVRGSHFDDTGSPKNCTVSKSAATSRTAAGRKQRYLLDSAPKLVDKQEFNLFSAEAPSRRTGSVAGGLTLKELMHFIGELYTTKRGADQKCRYTRVPRLTMEQHMYVYLSHKYGLPKVVQAVSSDILMAVKKYIEPEFVNYIDVRVFALILANRLDEEFAVVIEKLELVALDHCARARRQRPETDRTSKHFILAHEVPAILRSLYRKEDVTKVLEQITEGASKRKSEAETDSPVTAIKVTDANRVTVPCFPSPRPLESISVAYFVNTCKSFQLDLREQFLTPIIQSFRNLPQMKPGIISTENAEKLLANLNVPATRIPSLLNFIDCHNIRCITFSECVYAMMIHKSPDFNV
eukprot:GEMP01050675.1.p1 GENE.GEMP01050675.1~~GEMP01050675.1.p1  ORF type:complete len:412 (+),score=61.28 GEMP01050675.1:40-1236(+)